MGNYSNEFSLEMVRNMWHPFNNLNGYVRDHIFPIKKGFDLGTNPRKIKHPANCCLISFVENSRKNGFSNMIEVDLDNLIKNWENKYGRYKFN